MRTGSFGPLRLSTLAVSLALLACGDRRDGVEIVLPDASPPITRVAIFFFGESEAPIATTGLFPVGEEVPARAAHSQGEVQRLAVAGYSSERLEDVYPPEDPLLSDAALKLAGDARLCLPAPSLWLEGAVSRGLVTEPAATPRHLTADWCGPVDACTLGIGEAHAIRLGDTIQDGLLGVPIDETRALVLLDGGQLYDVDLPAGPARRLPPLSAGVRYNAVARTSDDRAWFLQNRGAVEVIDLRGDLSPHPGPAVATSTWTLALAASRGHDVPFEVFAWSADGALWRSGGAAFELVHQVATPPRLTGSQSLVWLGPGSVAALSTAAEEVVLFTQGTARRVALTDAPISASWVEGIGAVIGSRSGSLFVIRGSTVEALTSLQDVRRVRRVAGFGARGLAFAIDDSVAFFYPEVGSCAARILAGSTGAIQDLVAFPGGVLVLANIGSFAATHAVFLEWQPPVTPVCVSCASVGSSTSAER